MPGPLSIVTEPRHENKPQGINLQIDAEMRRSGKTRKDHHTGKWQRHLDNKADVAVSQKVGAPRVICGSENPHKGKKRVNARKKA